MLSCLSKAWVVGSVLLYDKEANQVVELQIIFTILVNKITPNLWCYDD